MIDKPCDLCGYLYAVYVCWPLIGGGPGKDICESCKREDDKKRKAARRLQTRSCNSLVVQRDCSNRMNWWPGTNHSNCRSPKWIS